MKERLRLARDRARENWALLMSGFYIMMMWLDNLPKLNEIHDFPEFQMLLNYKIGFIQRGFIGTLLLPIKYFTPKEFSIIFAILTVLFICVYMGFCVRIFRGRLEKKISEYWILLITFLPMTVGCLFDKLHYVLLDAILIMILLINAYVLTLRKRGGGILLSTLLVTIGMLIHSVYAFFFYAGTFNILLWLFWKTKERKYLFAAIVDTFIVVALLLYFNNGRPILFMPYEKIAEYIVSRTSENMEYGLSLIHMWFSSDSSTILNEFKQTLSYFVVHEAIIFYLMMLPIITWIFTFWHRYYVRAGKPKVFWIFALSIISALPYHIFMTDHGRAMAGVFWCQLVLLFSVLNYNDSDEERGIFTEIFHERTETQRWGILLYLLILEPVGIITVNRPLHRIWLAVRGIFHHLI